MKFDYLSALCVIGLISGRIDIALSISDYHVPSWAFGLFSFAMTIIAIVMVKKKISDFWMIERKKTLIE